MKYKGSTYAVAAFLLTVGLLCTLYGGWRAQRVTYTALHGSAPAAASTLHETAQRVADVLPPRAAALYRVYAALVNALSPDKKPDSV